MLSSNRNGRYVAAAVWRAWVCSLSGGGVIAGARSPISLRSSSVDRVSSEKFGEV